ncbi:hypothetical protein L3X38_031714 [Prunus dulcis]|uniref:DUF4283 domain-containing protein n=1 Tax=Prunus dulcis TaxID=3755 RepID=A0AAD4YUB1_PRUDU|nr:hypothetical protein L3X38_031714 [Prunus dulcis]
MEQGSPGGACKQFRFTKRGSFVGTGSFRDKLMNKVNLVKNVGIDVDSLDDNYADLTEADDVVVSCGDKRPCIQFFERAMDRICKPWKNALIVKLLGRSHTNNNIHDRLQHKWSLKCGWKLVDLYLVLQKWRPGFCPITAHITRMAPWIRVSAIQLECFDVWALKRIRNLLGNLLKIDALTTAQNMGKFARLCVELDLTKPLEAFIQINPVWYNIEYEGLPDICYLCGHYGHKKEHYTLKEKFASDRPGAESSTAGLEVGADIIMG